MIVDDEPTVREGLRRIILWEEYGFEVVGIAKDGYSALDKYKELSPDLVISDIRMTGMGGLELLRNFQEMDNDVQCLILSGYADFDYARTAIQRNAAGYLLKPIDEAELVDYLVKIEKQLKKQNEVNQLTVNEKERQRELFILSILGKTENRETKILSLTEEYGLRWDQYEVLLLRLEETSEPESMLLTIKEDIKKVVETEKKGIVFVNEAYLGILMKSTMNNKKARHLLFLEMKSIIDSYFVNFTAALGSAVDQIVDISDAYTEATKLIQTKFFFPKDTLLLKGKEMIKPSINGNTEMNVIIDKLYFALDIGINDTLETTVSDILYVAEDIYAEEEVKNYYVYALTTVLNKLLKSKPEKEAYITSQIEKVLEVYQQRNLIDLQNFVSNLVKSVYLEFEHSADTDYQLKRLLVLIDQRYDENLKLDKLADLFNYNSAYLGKIFKKYTGEYFNTYLDKVRIERAKELLIEGLKVYRVAEIVGYNNVDYFHSKFKKYVGVSPSVYRRNNRKSMVE
ncbi:response regulator [Salipaludibacillus sp. HK11]|uniref:response regulator transcription factor n=1 Tax=Salipaludibacillus sp. HK11 TaxID=3394320 RepID=UPI0039FBB36D